MPLSYGKESRANIAELDGRLQRLLHRFADIAPDIFDIKVICGHRGEVEQNAAYAAGNSTHPWPESAHNKSPSKAFDFTPFPFTTWGDMDRFLLIQGAIRLVAELEHIPLKPLISWSDPKRASWDGGHVELA